MPVWEMLARFAEKPPRDKLVAIGATLRTAFFPGFWPAIYRLGSLMLQARVSRKLTKLPHLLLYHGLTPGDDLMCTAILRELRRRHRPEVVAMISNYPELFAGNEDAAHILPAGDDYSLEHPPLSLYRQFAEIWGSELIRLFHSRFDGRDQSEAPSCHYIAELCASAGLTGPVLIRPYLALSEEEKSQATWASGQIVIQSSGMGARNQMRNKEWFPERYQAVVDILHNEWQFVQVGSRQDPPLNHVIDLRGATTMRESAAILHHARVYVGHEGFLMHLARAVECPSVIIYGGRIAPWQIGYICNLNLYTAVPCAPCWRNNLCDFDRKCMTDISVERVVSAVRHMIDKPRGPLAVESVEIA